MLYRTHHPSLFHFPSATSSSLLGETEMECVEAVFLKTSIRKEMALKQTQLQPPFVEDSFVANVSNVASYDDFSIDELLDFSNEDGFMLQEEEEEDPSGFPSSSPKQEPTTTPTTKSQNSRSFSTKDDFTPVAASELDVPVEELESLEWLSHFVEDSNSEYSTPFPAGAFLPKPVTVSEPEKPVQTDCCFKTPVPAKARSKRPRTGAKIWSLGSPSLTESSSSSTTTTSSSSSSSLILDSVEPVEKPPLKKQKKKLATGEGLHGAAAPRRCSHCGVQKTPQWRAGPLGAKTLCNACGVRYKSGRLFPEYRPACSPTFSSELHSNHHRKVLEMRKKNEVILGETEPGMAAPPVVPSF